MRNGKTGNERRCETEKLKRAERAHVFLREWRVHQSNACRPSLTNDCPSCVCVCDPPVIFFLYLMHVFRNRRWIKMRKNQPEKEKRKNHGQKEHTTPYNRIWWPLEHRIKSVDKTLFDNKCTNMHTNTPKADLLHEHTHLKYGWYPQKNSN